MKKIVTLLGASTLVFGVLSSSVEAKKVYYEINGKRYSYSTNNRAQTAEARKRIQAAKAAEAAKAKAEAERAKNPLVAAFGSQTQREAEQAQERLNQLLSGKAKGQAVEASNTIEKASSAPRGKSSSDEAKEASPSRPQQKTAALTQEAPQTAKPPAAAQTAVAVAEPVTSHHLAKKVRSVSFDVESGIKTTIMIDGSIQEEPFDSSVLTQLAPEHEDGNSLMAFVKQLRKSAPEETTGSVSSRAGHSEFAHVNPRQPRN